MFAFLSLQLLPVPEPAGSAFDVILSWPPLSFKCHEDAKTSGNLPVDKYFSHPNLELSLTRYEVFKYSELMINKETMNLRIFVCENNNIANKFELKSYYFLFDNSTVNHGE